MFRFDFNSIYDEPDQDCLQYGVGVGKNTSFPKICRNFSTMVKLCTVMPYPNKIQKKCKNHVTHPLSSADISTFSADFAISKNADIYCISIHNF